MQPNGASLPQAGRIEAAFVRYQSGRHYGQGSELRINYTAIPAPGALALIGLAGLAAGRRRRR